MKKLKLVHLVCAARPNFMKIAPLWHALSADNWAKPLIVHTGQHYDKNMSDNFFRDFNLPKPDIALEVGSGTHATQTGLTMIEYERLCSTNRPDLTVVVGDVNATLACALVCAKMGILLVHLEAGLRSFDRSMPEEINRIVTDSVSDLCLTPSEDGDQNLLREGIPRAKINFVGNIMIDTLEMLRPKILITERILEDECARDGYYVVTIHRASNVDTKLQLSRIAAILSSLSETSTLVFPVHPRTKKQFQSFGLWMELANNPRICLLEPLGYIEFMQLVMGARAVITDSGGIQEETSYLGIPCFTLRNNTERPITLSLGTNRLISIEELENSITGISESIVRKNTQIPLWDGKTASRVVKALKDLVIP